MQAKAPGTHQMGVAKGVDHRLWDNAYGDEQILSKCDDYQAEFEHQSLLLRKAHRDAALEQLEDTKSQGLAKVKRLSYG